MNTFQDIYKMLADGRFEYPKEPEQTLTFARALYNDTGLQIHVNSDGKQISISHTWIYQDKIIQAVEKYKQSQENLKNDIKTWHDKKNEINKEFYDLISHAFEQATDKKISSDDVYIILHENDLIVKDSVAFSKAIKLFQKFANAISKG